MKEIWFDRLTFITFFLLIVGLLMMIFKVASMKGWLYVLGLLVIIVSVTEVLHHFNKKLKKLLENT